LILIYRQVLLILYMYITISTVIRNDSNRLVLFLNQHFWENVEKTGDDAMARAEDLRVQRTKKLIQQAFYECVKEKGFEKTTVSDIAKKAMINRATFYLHYQDKMDLLRCLEEEVLSDIEKIFQPATREYIQVCREKGVPVKSV